MSDLHNSFRQTFCGCTKMIKIKNKSINKKTKKQTNKHFLHPKYLSQIKSNLHKIFRGTFCWCPTKIKTKNKQIYKQTNKQINILEPIYLSQIKSDLHEILRVSDGNPSATKWGPEGPPVVGQRPKFFYTNHLDQHFHQPGRLKGP